MRDQLRASEKCRHSERKGRVRAPAPACLSAGPAAGWHHSRADSGFWSLLSSLNLPIFDAGERRTAPGVEAGLGAALRRGGIPGAVDPWRQDGARTAGLAGSQLRAGLRR